MIRTINEFTPTPSRRRKPAAQPKLPEPLTEHEKKMIDYINVRFFESFRARCPIEAAKLRPVEEEMIR
jgi:hypothetical protein